MTVFPDRHSLESDGLEKPSLTAGDGLYKPSPSVRDGLGKPSLSVKLSMKKNVIPPTQARDSLTVPRLGWRYIPYLKGVFSGK